MPTFIKAILNNQILLGAAVSLPSATPGGDPVSFPALADTGAQGTWISQKVVDAVQPHHIGKMNYATIAQQGETDLFKVRMDIPVEMGDGRILTGTNLDASLLPYQPPNYDVILGMNFLCLFHITIVGGNFILSN